MLGWPSNASTLLGLGDNQLKIIVQLASITASTKTGGLYPSPSIAMPINKINLLFAGIAI